MEQHTNIALTFLDWLIDFQTTYWMLGFYSSAFVFALAAKTGWKMKLFAFIGIDSALPLVAYFLIPVVAGLVGSDAAPSNLYLALWLMSVVTSHLLAHWWLRTGAQRAAMLKKKLQAESDNEQN